MNLRALTMVLLASCAGSSDDGSADATATDSGEPWQEPDRDDAYIDDDDPLVPFEFDADAVASVVESALLTARSIEASPVVGAYAEVLEGAAVGCPTWSSDGATDYWIGGCTTDAGTTFEGYGTSVLYDGTPEGDIAWEGVAIYGVGSVQTPGGYSFEAAGSAGLLAGVQTDGTLVYYTYMQWGFAYDGPAADGTWLAGEVSPDLVTYAVHNDASGAKALYLTGRIEIEDGPMQAAVFEQLTLANSEGGSLCPTEPAGGLSLLAEDGWYDLTFHGTALDGTSDFDPSLCDGCGTAWHKGVGVGEVCIDFSSMTSWSVHPWEEL